MVKNKERFEHGEHNEEVCDLLALQKKFPDWTITTAFYASLHFVSYKIFPFNHPVKDHPDIHVENIEAWQRIKSHRNSKRHELLKDLVSDHCPTISPDYDWLLGICMTARYHNFQHDQLIVDKAVRLMKAIKKDCHP